MSSQALRHAADQQSPNPRLLSMLLLIVATGGFCAGVSMRVMDSMLPFLSREFNISLSEAGQSITYFSVAYAISLLFVGMLGDRFGKLRVVVLACVLCSLATLACALAPDFLFLRAGRLLSGATSSAVMTLGMAWVGDTMPYERRQSTLSRLLIGMSLGVAAGTVVGGFAADQTISWRAVFGVLAACFLLVGLALSLMLRKVGPQMLLPREAQGGDDAPATDGGLSSRAMRLILLTVFSEGALYLAALAFVPSHLHARYGISLSMAGSIVMLAGLGGLMYALCARRLVNLGERRLIAIGGALMGTSFFIVGFSPIWEMALPACFCAGLGFYMLHSTLQTRATQVAPTRRGMAMAVFSSSFFFGQSLGVALFGRIIELANSSAVMATAAIGLSAITVLLTARTTVRQTS
jgi:predicted MFS family arabinose efflux permease